jgi:hypothetical protein
MQYIMTQKDAAIIPEVRYPHIRNPNLKGVVCKHLNRTLKVLPFHLGNLAAAVKEQRKALEAKNRGGHVGGDHDHDHGSTNPDDQ